MYIYIHIYRNIYIYIYDEAVLYLYISEIINGICSYTRFASYTTQT